MCRVVNTFMVDFSKEIKNLGALDRFDRDLVLKQGTRYRYRQTSKQGGRQAGR